MNNADSPALAWEKVQQSGDNGASEMYRARVPGGWLVRFASVEVKTHHIDGGGVETSYIEHDSVALLPAETWTAGGEGEGGR